jgi:hypothetical protein
MWVFFRLKKYCSSDFLVDFTKFALIEKQGFFMEHLVFWLFYYEGKEIKRNKKKHPPQTMSSTCKKSFSSIGRGISEKRGRKVGSFLTLRTPISHRRKHLVILSLARLLLYYSSSICPESFKFF